MTYCKDNKCEIPLTKDHLLDFGHELIKLVTLGRKSRKIFLDALNEHNLKLRVVEK